MTVHVVLIRHARSTANAAGVLAGRAEGVALDDVGMAQARQLVARLEGMSLDGVIGSPMLRCRQTTAPLLESIGLDYIEDARLIECDYGSWTGQALVECAVDPLWEQIQSAPSQVTFPGGESMQDMADRSVAAVRDAVERASDGATLAVVSHGDPIKAIVADALGMALDRFQRIVIDPASITLLRYSGDRVFAVRINDSEARVSELLSKNPDAMPGGGAGGGGATSAATRDPESL